MRTQISVDLYNALNANPIESYNQAFIAGGAWLTPTGILHGAVRQDHRAG